MFAIRKAELRSHLLKDRVELPAHNRILSCGPQQRRSLKRHISIDDGVSIISRNIEDRDIPIIPRTRRGTQSAQRNLTSRTLDLIRKLAQRLFQRIKHSISVRSVDRFCGLESQG